MAVVLDFVLHVDQTVIFVVSALAILGLAWVIGLATERLGAMSGPQVGGILNATFGNIAELIIAFFALQAGLIDVVKASITGSIIGNLLLVLGAAVLFGGLRHGTQRFDQRIAGSNAALLVVAAIGLFVPAVFALSSARPEGGGTVTEESVLVAILLMVGYVISVVFQFTNPERTLGGHDAPEGHAGPAWTRRTTIVVLIAAAALLAVLSEVLVGSIEPFIEPSACPRSSSGSSSSRRSATSPSTSSPSSSPSRTGWSSRWRSATARACRSRCSSARSSSSSASSSASR